MYDITNFLLGQIIYTSFPEIGLKTLASAQVPTEVQQAFVQCVASQHWDAYDPPRSKEYRAVYLHQLTQEQTLFGWLYNDGVDDVGRAHVPYFICYYLKGRVQNLQLKIIFNCLQKGPIALIDRHKLSDSLETIMLPNLWSYQEARPGVAIPFNTHQRSQVALKRGELLNLFVPISEQGTVINLDEQELEHSFYTHYIIEGIKKENATKTAVSEVEAVAQQSVIICACWLAEI